MGTPYANRVESDGSATERHGAPLWLAFCTSSAQHPAGTQNHLGIDAA